MYNNQLNLVFVRRKQFPRSPTDLPSPPAVNRRLENPNKKPIIDSCFEVDLGHLIWRDTIFNFSCNAVALQAKKSVTRIATRVKSFGNMPFKDKLVSSANNIMSQLASRLVIPTTLFNLQCNCSKLQCNVERIEGKNMLPILLRRLP